MKLAIVGSRHFKHYKLFKSHLRKFTKDKTIELIISGGADGVDTLAERYAKEKNIEILIIIFNNDLNKIGDFIFSFPCQMGQIWSGSRTNQKQKNS